MICREAEQKLGLRKWEIARYTLSQLLNALDTSDPKDPMKGCIPIKSLADIPKVLPRIRG